MPHGVHCRRVLHEGLRLHLGEGFRRLAEQEKSRVLGVHPMPDSLHILLFTPPKYAVSEVAGDIKGKSAIHLARPRSTFLGNTELPPSTTGGQGTGWDEIVHRFDINQ